MNVVVATADQPIWSHGYVGKQRCGVACKTFLADGTQTKIIEALELALAQARFEAELSAPDKAE